MVVDLTPHLVDLLLDDLGQFVMPRRRGLVRLVRQHGQRRLQAVREIAGCRLRARDRLVAVVEQRVEVAHEWLDFRRIGPFHMPLTAFSNARKPPAQVVEGRQAAPNLREAADEAQDRGGHEQRVVGQEQGVVATQRRQDDVRDGHQPTRPQQGADDDAGAEGAGSHQLMR